MSFEGASKTEQLVQILDLKIEEEKEKTSQNKSKQLVRQKTTYTISTKYQCFSTRQTTEIPLREESRTPNDPENRTTYIRFDLHFPEG